MIPYSTTLLLGTGVIKWSLNTFGPTGALITLAGSPSLAARINGGATVTDASLSIAADVNDGGGAHTGEHQCQMDVDDVTLALQDGDLVEVLLAAGTVNGISVVNVVIARFEISNGTLPANTISDIETAAGVGVVAAGPIEADVKEVNGVPVVGDGQTGTEWGPA